MDQIQVKARLIKARELQKLFDPQIAIRTIRDLQKAKVIPFIKLGRSVYFDPDEVLRHLKKYNQVNARGAETAKGGAA